MRQKREGKLTGRPQEEIKEGAEISNSTRHSCGLTFSHLTSYDLNIKIPDRTEGTWDKH